MSSKSTFIRVKGWDKYQHYKDRNPPWIKLHQELLTSLTWALADNASRVLAIALMMLAAKTNNKIPANEEYVKRVAYLHELPDFSQLIHLEFIEIIDDEEKAVKPASKVLADARPETETEEETDQSKKDLSARKARGVSSGPQVITETRHTRTQKIVMDWYLGWSGVQCPWDGSEAKQHSSMLKAWPAATDEQFLTCLENLARSDCIPKGDRPREWLGKLPKFLKGPLDQFWKSKHLGNGNGNGDSRAEQKERDRKARFGEREAQIKRGNGVD